MNMRTLEMIRKDIKDREKRLKWAKENYADIVIEYIAIGYDVRNHPTPEEYRKDVVDLMEELNELHDEHHEAMHAEGC